MKKYKAIDVAIIVVLIFIAVLIAVVGYNAYIMANEVVNDSDEATKIANQDLGNILTGTVELTLPKDFIELISTEDEPFDYNLTEEQKENGFTEARKNEDGSVTYTIKKKEYEIYIEELRQETKNSLNKMTSDSTFTTIERIEYTENFEKITITVDKDNFEKNLISSSDGLIILNCGLTSYMYQMFDIDSAGKCTVEVKDSASGEIFQTTVYPDDMQEN